MKTILGMLLLIAAIGITTGTDYSEIEMIGEDVLEDSANDIYKVDIDVSSSRVLVDYRTGTVDADEIAEDIGAVIGTYVYIVQYYGNVGDLIAKIRAPSGELVATYSCKSRWVDDLDPADKEMMVDVLLKVTNTIELA